MMKNTILLLFLLLGFLACSDDNATFDVSTEGLNIRFTPVAGGAMMHYTLPDNSDIFSINIQYTNLRGEKILKSGGYGSDSILLDGFARKQEAVVARVSFVNKRGEESSGLDYQFGTLDSAPWSFFDDLKVSPSWNGFQISYKSPSVATGMAHVFYMGTNPLTKEEDTILVKSFPISRLGGSEKFEAQQGRDKYTVIIRTEDFKGFRVRQEAFPDVDAFPTEKFPMSPENFNDFNLSVENVKAKTGVKYLFDGETRGTERFVAMAGESILRPYTGVYGTYLAGPSAFGKPIMIDLKEERILSKLRFYCLFAMPNSMPTNSDYELGTIWGGKYENKLPCDLKIYGSKNSQDPNSGDWVYLGELVRDPLEAVDARWSYPTTVKSLTAISLEYLLKKDPIYVDVVFPPVYDTYRYVKIIVNDTYRDGTSPIIYNTKQYITWHELEVYVKKK